MEIQKDKTVPGLLCAVQVVFWITLSRDIAAAVKYCPSETTTKAKKIRPRIRLNKTILKYIFDRTGVGER